MNTTVNDFCENHRIRIIDDNKRAHTITKMNVRYFQDSSDYNRVMHEALPLETEKLLTVEISESELQKLAEFESQVYNNMRKHGHHRMFEMLMEQKEREKYLKEKYPAVKKAYEQYSTVLKLAESGEL